ncbi:MAG: hypothetical protein R2716_05905 [Microthrixaceae bacterium]
MLHANGLLDAGVPESDAGYRAFLEVHGALAASRWHRNGPSGSGANDRGLVAVLIRACGEGLPPPDPRRAAAHASHPDGCGGTRSRLRSALPR